jgi:hypothetical protein
MINLKEVTMKSPIVLLESLLDDFQRLNPDVKGLKRDIITLELRYEYEGYGFLSIALPSLGSALVRGLAAGRFCCPIGFKTTKGGTIPRLFSGMFSEVFEPVSGQLKESPDMGVLKALYGVLLLFKKTQMSDESNDELDSKAVAEFFSTDAIAKEVIIPDREEHLLSNVCKMILPDLSNHDFSVLSYKHGPGAVFEGFSSNQKWSGLYQQILNEYVDTSAYGLDLFDSLRDIQEFPQTEVSDNDRASRRQARLVTVPKNSTQRRTITVEPLLNQFIQQGLNTALRDSILKCGILRNCLSLTDQSKNQQLALEGSLNDNWATIDLKSASDLLSVSLVKIVFGRHASFFDALMDCRSTSVVCSKGATMDLGKFAGMGNATTFPVQSISFAVTGICAILDCWGVSPTYRNVQRASRHIRVFGDDIIIDSKYARQAVHWLQRVGLRVNTKKSFLEGNFKESCGVDAYKGVDITPLYCRYRPDDPSTDPKLIASFVSLSNQAWIEGLYKFANKLQELVEEKLGKTLPLVSVASGGLGWHTRKNAYDFTKWNNKLHRWEITTYVIKPLLRRDVLSGSPALLKFFLTPLLGRSVGHLEKSEMRFKSRIVRRRVAV